MASIKEEIKKLLDESKISDILFEGANIIVYTKSKDYFLTGKDEIKKVVNEIKKRVELRPDPSITMDPEKAKKEIKKIIGEEAGIDEIKFDPERSCVIVEVEKPGLAIGKGGELLKKIKEKTLWVPTIQRKPAIKSQIIEDIRGVLYEHSDFRRNFLNKTGERIYNGWLREKKHEWVRTSFLGGARQVGRSSILLQTQESRILLDCGIDVSDEKNEYPFLDAPEFNIKELDAVIISHSHLDHIGLVPLLFKYGYEGPVYCTAPTRDVGALLLLDLIKIQRMEGKDPIFTVDDIKEMVKRTITLDYNEVTDITPDVRITLYNAGHILGSSMIHLHIGNGLHNLLYTGDLKYAKTNLLSNAVTRFPRLETVIIESTYGGERDILPSKREEEEYLKTVIKETHNRGGKILIPVLGSGRAQEIMLIVERLIREKEVEPLPVYLDGMLWDITAIHTAYPEYLNTNVKQAIFHKNENPFISPIFQRIGSGKERQALIENEGPCIILATSGMLVGGPSVQYLKAFAPNEKNSLVFSCYQPPGGLGYKIKNGERHIVLGQSLEKADILDIKMQVHKVTISAHAGRNELMGFIRNCQPRPNKVIVMHGEPSKSINLASAFHRKYKLETSVPRNLDALRLR